MSALTLNGDTLGEKHKHHNKLVQDAIANKQYELRNVSDDDSDIDNLLKIDIASKTRNVDYIIQVMKSNDMLYAATAIKKSKWLITEPQYANIINPEYLHTQLLPSMNTKTFNKLMLHIRLNLKDEKRVETFYEYLKETDGAYKWLQNCSIPFIENVIKNERLIPLSLFKRLCRRSAHFIEYYKKIELSSKHDVKKQILFLLKSNTADVLKILEDKKYDNYPELGKRKTKIVMKTCPERILNNFEVYVGMVDLSVVAKYLNKADIKSFLHRQVRILGYRLADNNTLKHFVNNMPEEERFEFIMKTFIDKTEMSLLFTDKERKMIESAIKPYQWYEYAPFYVALPKLERLIRKEPLPSERCAMLSVLITCSKRNPQHVKALLDFVTKKHINEPIIFKIQLANNIISKISTFEFDVETWNVLNQFFHSMEVYAESDNNVQNIQMCLQSIILYKILHDEPVPDIVEQKVSFCTFKTYQRRLSQQQRCKLFTYLLHTILAKIQSINSIAGEIHFKETIVQLKNAFILLRDWKKDIYDYPYVIDEIKKLIKMKENNCGVDLRGLYHIKKSWRKYMFEESLSLSMSEDTCLNALKHNPQLLKSHDREIETLRTNDALSLRRLLTKLRVYWPHSLAQNWTDTYLQNIDNPTEQKAVIKGLFLLLSRKQIVDMAKKHAPGDSKINWGETDQKEITIRKNIAKHLYLARPLIPLDTILWYAKGDYLQHAVPSLNAILYNLSEVESREHLPKLLYAPVSLQKFGLHLAFFKLKTEDLKSIFWEIWNSTVNISIQSIIFRHTYTVMCNVKDPVMEKVLWELLSVFMDVIFSGKLGHVENVPISVRAEYYMKSYKFIRALPASENFEAYVEDLIQYAPKIMDILDRDFVANNLISEPACKFCSYESEFIEVFANYILCGKNEEDQLYRFKNVINPALEAAFEGWGSMRSGVYYIKHNFNNFLTLLVRNFRKYVTLNKIPIPTKLFVEINDKIEERLPLLENYILYTSWKLITEYVKLFYQHVSISKEFESTHFTESDFEDEWLSSDMISVWKDVHVKISPSVGALIVKCLKEDVERYSQTIYCIFSDALKIMFKKLCFQDDMFVLEALKHMIEDNDYIPSYLVVSKVIPKHCTDELECVKSSLLRKIESHVSATVRVHYYIDHCHQDQN